VKAPLPDVIRRALADGVDLLRAIDGDSAAADALMAAYRDRHPDVRCTILEDRPPGSTRTERDLHLVHPDVGGISIAWREQDGSPWAVTYADHWAAHYVLSVDARPVTIRGALLALRSGAGPDVLGALVDEALIGTAVDALDPRLSDEQVQDEVDRARRALGLHQRTRFLSWLAEVGLDETEFVGLCTERVRRAAWEDVLTSGQIEERFTAARSDFDVVTVLEIIGCASSGAAHLRAALAQGSPWQALLERLPAGCTATVRTRRAFELGALPDVEAGIRIVVSRTPAEDLDAATVAAVRRVLVEAWLEERRAAARVHWYWR
jgi:hypothetical protein